MNFTLIGALFFFLISLLHLMRLIFGVQVMANDYLVPLWFSIFGFLVPLFFSIMLFKEGRSGRK
jgi:hypothetical protein